MQCQGENTTIVAFGIIPQPLGYGAPLRSSIPLSSSPSGGRYTSERHLAAKERREHKDANTQSHSSLCVLCALLWLFLITTETRLSGDSLQSLSPCGRTSEERFQCPPLDIWTIPPHQWDLFISNCDHRRLSIHVQPVEGGRLLGKFNGFDRVFSHRASMDSASLVRFTSLDRRSIYQPLSRRTHV